MTYWGAVTPCHQPQPQIQELNSSIDRRFEKKDVSVVSISAPLQRHNMEQLKADVVLPFNAAYSSLLFYNEIWTE